MFALSRDSLRTRLSGLLGEVRFGCVDGVLCFPDLSESLTLGANGVANGDFVCVFGPRNGDPSCLDGEPPGTSGEGDSGDLGDPHPPPGDFLSWNFDGERESERLILSTDLAAELKSALVLQCVGDGSVRVPLFPEYVMVQDVCCMRF